MSMAKLIKVLLLSAVPLIEQRGAIPLGIFVYKMNPILVTVVSYIGSLIPVPFILILFNAIFKWMKKYEFFAPINKFIENKLQKNTKKFEKYEEVALITFIGIPLPTTGLWTGSAIAAFLRLDKKRSFLCAAIGGLISAVLITGMCVIFPAMFNK